MLFSSLIGLWRLHLRLKVNMERLPKGVMHLIDLAEAGGGLWSALSPAQGCQHRAGWGVGCTKVRREALGTGTLLLLFHS